MHLHILVLYCAGTCLVCTKCAHSSKTAGYAHSLIAGEIEVDQEVYEQLLQTGHFLHMQLDVDEVLHCIIATRHRKLLNALQPINPCAFHFVCLHTLRDPA